MDAGAITNTGTVTARPPLGAGVTPRDRNDGAIQSPAITIVKSANVASYSGVGTPITYAMRYQRR